MNLSTPISMQTKLRWASASLAVLAMLVGCAEAPPKAPVKEPQVVFYPPPPDPPRIQHLATFESARDVGAPRSGLADFLLGEEKPGSALVRPYGAALFD